MYWNQLTAKPEKQTTIKTEAAKDFISVVMLVQRHRVKHWIAHGERRPLFILKTVKQFENCFPCNTVLQLRVRKMLDTFAFHPPSYTAASCVGRIWFSCLVCLGVGVHLLAVGTSVVVNYVVFNNIFWNILLFWQWENKSAIWPFYWFVWTFLYDELKSFQINDTINHKRRNLHLHICFCIQNTW